MLALALGVIVGVLWPDGDRGNDRSQLSAIDRCLRWFDDLGAGEVRLAEEQRVQVRKMVRRGAFETEEEALFQLWAGGRREPCARAARFGLVGSDGSLGPGAIDILDKCFFVHSLRLVSPDPESAERRIRECRQIDEVIGRDPNDFG